MVLIIVAIVAVIVVIIAWKSFHSVGATEVGLVAKRFRRANPQVECRVPAHLRHAER